jgi:uncharacterized protein YydD (DUF2326 family)
MLKKISSETNLIKEVTFHDGLNIIVGKYSSRDGINGIGKSSLIRLIDYCFISDSAEDIFKGIRYDFLREEKHLISLDFKINQTYFKITRSFELDDPIKLQENNDISEYSKDEMRTLMMNKFFPTSNIDCYVRGDRFRTLMRFFIKDDLNNTKRVNPLDFVGYSASPSELAIYNFFLFGLSNNSMYDFQDNLDEYSKFGKLIKSIEKRVKEETGKEISELKTEKIKIESEVESIRKSLENYKFQENYKNAEDEVTKITGTLREKLREHAGLENRLVKLEGSYEKDVSIDLDRIRKLYDDSVAEFGTLIEKKLEEIINFKNSILDNRKRYVLDRISKIKQTLEEIEEEMELLDLKRAENYKVLNEKGALDSIKNSYENYILKKSHIDQFTGYISYYDDYTEKKMSKKADVQKNKSEIVTAIKKQLETVDNLRTLFIEVLANAIFANEDFGKSFFDIEISPSSKINSLPFKVDVQVPKADALGHFRLKIAAYDLMVFLNSLESLNFRPRFLIHDGVFHGISNTTIINTLNFMDKKLKSSIGSQYIVTFNEDEVSLENEGRYGKYNFNVSEKIIATYSNAPKEMIFKRNFI